MRKLKTQARRYGPVRTKTRPAVAAATRDSAQRSLDAAIRTGAKKCSSRGPCAALTAFLSEPNRNGLSYPTVYNSHTGGVRILGLVFRRDSAQSIFCNFCPFCGVEQAPLFKKGARRSKARPQVPAPKVDEKCSQCDFTLPSHHPKCVTNRLLENG